MTEQKLSSLLKTQILDQVEELDIPGYMMDETKDIVRHLNYYKLKNLFDNMDDFKTFLLELDHHNTQQIKTLLLNHLKLWQLK